MRRQIRHLRPFAVLLLAGGLAGGLTACGGSDGGSPREPTRVDLSDVSRDFMAGAGTVEVAAGQSADHGDIAFSCAAGGPDCTIEVAVDTNGMVSATSTGGTVTAMNTAAFTMRITPMAVDLSPVTAGFVAGADTVEVAAGQSADHGDIAFSCAAGGPDCSVAITLSNDGSVSAMSTGGMVTAMNSADYESRIQTRAEALDTAIDAVPAATVPDLLNADGSGTPAVDSMLMAMADAARAEIAGWDDAVYARTNEGSLITGTPESTDTFVIYSNKEEPAPTAFALVHTLDTDADGDTVNDSLIVDVDNLGFVSGVAEFPSAVNQKDVPFDDDAAFMGMYDGATGTYTCVSMCTLSTDTDANLDAVGGTWHFTPDDDEHLVPVADADYMHFGYWMNESEDNNQPVFRAAAIAGGTEESAIATIQSLEGRATYDGAATGLYVKRALTTDGEIESRTAGQFTADVMLRATFGGARVPAVDHYSIHGSITSFMDRDGAAIDSSWSVNLEPALFGSQQGATFVGDTEGDQGQMGAWNGRFFGPVAVDSDATMAGNQSTLPSGVAGTFDAQFTNGAVMGAFGAEKD